jgi:hypothetical protein
MRLLNIILLSVLTGIFFTVSMPARATATFARQTGMPCASCHFQNFPALTPFGRLFKSGGFSLMDTQVSIEGSAMSLPLRLNASVVTKLRYQRSNGPKVPGTRTTNDGETQFPDELLVMIGGHINDNIGFLVELDPHLTDPLVSGLKIPMIRDMGGLKLGAIAFNTSSQGVAYGFELLNTGALRFARVAEDRSAISAQQYVGTATKAQGVAFVASNSRFFANFSKWSPRAMRENSSSPTANYLRLAATPWVGAWDLGFGMQAWSGTATEPASLAPVDARAWALDAQMHGAVKGLPLGLYLAYANAAGSAAGATVRNLFNGNPEDRTAATLAGQLGVIPGRATVLLGYRRGDSGKAVNSGDNALMLGGTYLVARNLQLQLNYTLYSGSAYKGTPVNGDRMMTLMLYGSF